MSIVGMMVCMGLALAQPHVDVLGQGYAVPASNPLPKSTPKETKRRSHKKGRPSTLLTIAAAGAVGASWHSFQKAQENFELSMDDSLTDDERRLYVQQNNGYYVSGVASGLGATMLLTVSFSLWNW